MLNKNYTDLFGCSSEAVKKQPKNPPKSWFQTLEFDKSITPQPLPAAPNADLVATLSIWTISLSTFCIFYRYFATVFMLCCGLFFLFDMPGVHERVQMSQ